MPLMELKAKTVRRQLERIQESPGKDHELMKSLEPVVRGERVRLRAKPSEHYPTKGRAEPHILNSWADPTRRRTSKSFISAQETLMNSASRN
jgi:hypothetical protein